MWIVCVDRGVSRTHARGSWLKTLLGHCQALRTKGGKCHSASTVVMSSGSGLGWLVEKKPGHSVTHVGPIEGEQPSTPTHPLAV